MQAWRRRPARVSPQPYLYFSFALGLFKARGASFASSTVTVPATNNEIKVEGKSVASQIHLYLILQT
jgi:hypothetical protein